MEIVTVNFDFSKTHHPLRKYRMFLPQGAPHKNNLEIGFDEGNIIFYNIVDLLYTVVNCGVLVNNMSI